MENSQPTRGKFWLIKGMMGGVLAGAVFALAEMVMNGALGKPFFGPLRMISSLVLGRQALQPSFSLAAAGFTGLLVHAVLSAVYGLIFVSAVKFRKKEYGAVSFLTAAGSLYGMLLWLLNFYVFAPLWWPQFTMVNAIWNGFAAHTFFFGTVLGAYIALVRNASLER
ncbi:MAG: hypothetical protein GF333_06795 [Candidatus Omnitrophica bacterium]|nr:hypothetical protein [Candidatus Omnitrophota bacterium]